jgi:hypothetical protein
MGESGWRIGGNWKLGGKDNLVGGGLGRIYRKNRKYKVGKCI